MMKDRNKPPLDRLHVNLGRFSISWDMIKREPAIARAVLKDVIIVRAEAMHHKDEIEYIGYHPKFLPVNFGHEGNTYEYVIEEISPATETEPAEYHIIWQLRITPR